MIPSNWRMHSRTRLRTYDREVIDTHRMTTRLMLPSRRVFPDDKPLLKFPRFAMQLNAHIVARTHYSARRVIAEFMPPRQTIARKPDRFTVCCCVDGVEFELMHESGALTPVVVHLEKPLGEIEEAMQRLPSVARAMLVFDHRARSGVPEAVAMVGLVNWLAPRMTDAKYSAITAAANGADSAMDDVFGAVARWMENGQ
jgi:hypothetical protein